VSRIARILDANANRAREALRVLEDAARFALDDAVLAASLKQLRHDLRDALAGLPDGWLAASRDTAGDAGTTLTTPGEQTRRGLADVARAAGSRLGEALRVIEEAAKIIAPEVAAQIKALRYRGYEAEQRLATRLGTGRGRQWTVCVLLTESACRRPWADVLRAAIDGGAECVQVREKTMAAAALRRRVDDVLAIARPAGVTVIVNDRADVALAAGADGVHLGRDDLSLADARRLAGTTLLLGASTHDLDEAAAAAAGGADYCGVGRMFDSGTKPSAAPGGLAYLRSFLEHHPGMPHLAIGGITPDNAGEVVAAGARGVAVSSAVCGAEHPDRVVAGLRGVVAGGEEKGRRGAGAQGRRG